MGALRRCLCRLVSLLRPGRAEGDLARELASHLALLEDEFRRRGMPAGQARRAARLALGGVERAKDLHRDERSFVWIDDARRDAGYAVRVLRRNPILAATAVCSLAIGIGANTAIFTLANALLFRAPAGVADPDRLVDIGVSRQDGGFNPGSYPTYLDIRRRATTLGGVYAHQMFPQALSLGAAGSTAGPERVFGHFVTMNYFDVLGARPIAGRQFASDSPDRGMDAASAGPIAVLSHRFWVRRFDSNPGVIGQTIHLNGQAFDVIGVAPEGFHGTGVLAGDMWLPLNMAALLNSRSDAIFADRSQGWLVMGGRLKPGVSVPAAAAELETIGRDLDREYSAGTGASGLRLLPSSSVPGNRRVVAGFIVLLMGIVSLVLLVACANVSGILLARAAARRREIAVRLAIGAGRARLVRQLLMETLVLFVLGGAAGLGLARAIIDLVVPSLPALPFPVSVSLALDIRIVVFTTGLSLMAALLSGLAPALQASKADLVLALKTDRHGSPGRLWLRHAFVVVQVSFSIVMIVAAGLFVRALERAGSVDPGFDPRGVELASVDLSMAGYTDASGRLFARDLVDRIRRLPEVESATIASVLPGGFEGIGLGGFTVPGARPEDLDWDRVDWNVVERGYFATLRIPLLAGRDFRDDDLPGVQPVVIVGEGVARQFWPGQNAIGKYLLQKTDAPEGSAAATTRAVLVVGVARDIKSSSLVDGLADSFVYLPLQQNASQMTSRLTIAARTSGGRRIADPIRILVASMNPNLPVVTSQTLDDSLALGLVPQRVAASVAGSLGIVGLMLAGIGIYGITAFAVTRRLREFGIRIALGAQGRDIFSMVFRQAITLIAIGGAIGLGLGAAAGQVLAGFLFGIPPLDPVTFGGTVALVAAIGLAACYGPSRRAMTVDPLVALRHE